MLPVVLVLLLDTRTVHSPTPQRQLLLFTINTSYLDNTYIHFCVLRFFIDTNQINLKLTLNSTLHLRTGVFVNAIIF